MNNKIDLYRADFGGSIFELIHKKWMLITAGTEDNCNTMTASWGGLGVLWNRNVSTIYVRPERYTYEFIEREGYYTVSFFGDEYRDVLTKCGTVSGREVDKISECGLTVKKSETGGIYFDQAELVLVCRKLYHQDLDLSGMTAIDPDNYYGEHGGVHRMYIGEIVETLGSADTK